ncbi:pectate lyase-like adhesive domain-containing protein, partial [Eubacterium sp. MSJ-13]|uniref:pectate lyase-like adhesive domain-containing protein n=1 Tax=Eubacterium sp. MSJ-13 TaxID=2841513 RepID=UPI0035303961
MSAQAENTTTVDTFEKFSAALKDENCNHIIVAKDFSLTLSAEEPSKQTIPLDIPANKTIEGQTPDITITSRGPIQITGDNVTFKNLNLHFTSTNALNAVPQREIFLAGHSLTLENVDTYLKGGNNSLTGTENELLPTVYGGGFHTNTNIGTNASLTVNRADNTPIFQDIIMGNDEQSGKYTEYKGKAELSLDAYTQVRGEVSTKLNSEATISITGTASDEIKNIPSITGNTNTTFNISGCNITKNTSVNGMGTINISNNGTFTPTASTVLNNISVEGDSCLDLTDMSDATINGDFSGGTTDKKADIIVGRDGRIILNKTASGSSQLYITNRQPSCTDMPSIDWPYITVNNDNSQADFNFAQKYIDNGYSLINNDNTWICHYEEPEKEDISNVEITDFTNNIYIKDIPDCDNEINDNSPSMNITWKYSNGTPWEAYTSALYGFYAYNTIISTDYWNSNDSSTNSQTDWSNPVTLTYLDDDMDSGKYYLIHNESEEQIKSGKYTLLFFSESIEGKTLDTVGDVKALKNLVIGSVDINFTATKTEPPTETTTEPTTEPTATPTAEPTATPTAEPTAT